MIERIQVDDAIFELAKHWSDFKGNMFSIRKDAGKLIVPNIAEILHSRRYPEAVRISNEDRHADFLIGGKRVDVKCKDRTVFCKDFYEVSVEARQIEYNVDEYAFYSYNNRERVMEYLGTISKYDFIKKAELKKKGDIDTSNNWRVSVDCYNLKISELSS
jgi:myo-inositol-hexaphosphate 3-phosphohydrolase